MNITLVSRTCCIVSTFLCINWQHIVKMVIDRTSKMVIWNSVGSSMEIGEPMGEIWIGTFKDREYQREDNFSGGDRLKDLRHVIVTQCIVDFVILIVTTSLLRTIGLEFVYLSMYGIILIWFFWALLQPKKYGSYKMCLI